MAKNTDSGNPDWARMSKVITNDKYDEMLDELFDDELDDALFADDEFDRWLSANLSPIQPPENFSQRVMTAIREEAAAKPAKVISFPLRRWAAAFGACAAALLLFVAVSAPQPQDNLSRPLLDKPMQLALEPQISQPQQQTLPPEIIVADNNETNQPAKPIEEKPIEAKPVTEQNVTDDVIPEQEVQDGELILPRSAYGTQAQSTSSARMVATVENSMIYQPTLTAQKALFYTSDADNIFSWHVDLDNPSEPQVSLIVEQENFQEFSSLLVNATAPIDNTTIVNSPDKTMMAQNSNDGLWISLLEGDVYKLSTEGNGKLLAWSPDSSKLLFTNADGTLFVGYPLERRIYQLAEQVKDICWGADNQTVLYVINNGTQDELYMVKTY
ncbi:MAG: hypothetical protein IJB67_00755 [Firmicutes bacterium]|nr:hypothetical protein [Bacillota bacterium]